MPSLFARNSAVLVGVVIAALGIWLSRKFGNPYFDLCAGVAAFDEFIKLGIELTQIRLENFPRRVAKDNRETGLVLECAIGVVKGFGEFRPPMEGLHPRKVAEVRLPLTPPSL